MFPKATDKSFEDMLKSNLLGKSPVFLKPKPAKPGQKESHFSVAHYAGTVSYNITGWLEKNKDPLNDTVVDMWKKGTNALVQLIYADHPGQGGDPAAAAGGGKGKPCATFSPCKSLSQVYNYFKLSSCHFFTRPLSNCLCQKNILKSRDKTTSLMMMMAGCVP